MGSSSANNVCASPKSQTQRPMSQSYADDTVASDPGCDFKPRFLQFISDALAGLFFVQGKLRMCVQMFVEFKKSRVFLVGARLKGFA